MQTLQQLHNMQMFVMAIFTTIIMLISVPTPSMAQNKTPDNSQNWTGYGQGTSWRMPRDIGSTDDMSIAWTTEIGEGYSQIVGIDNDIYTMSGSGTKQKTGPKSVLTTTTNTDARTGKPKWKHEHTTRMYASQETFGGATVSPRSTPVIAGQHLLTIGFTGHLHCLNRETGNVVWQKDLVKDLGADPVQFGFSSSLVVDPTTPTQVCPTAAGKDGGFYCLNIADGSVVWKAICKTPSYATPVAARIDNVAQWIVVTENQVQGFERKTGKVLWQYRLPNPELTNVPTPIVLDNGQLMISGQGCAGTRCIRISQSNGRWMVKEQWSTKSLQFFYTNWVKVTDRVVVGCNERFLAAIDTKDGSVLGRWRGYGNGNVTLANDKLVVIDGRGQLSFLDIMPTADTKQVTGFRPVQQFQVVEGRSWTPLSFIGTRIFVRGSSNLACVQPAGKAKPLQNLVSAPKVLQLNPLADSKPTVDPVAEIFAAFETKGQQAALALYAKRRSSGQLDEDARIELARVARQQNLKQLVQLILGHATEDFPKSEKIKTAVKALSGN